MLQDSERKLFRIIYNHFAQHRQIPNLAFLQRSTGKSRDQIQSSLIQLVEDEYIQWDGSDPLSILMLKQPDTNKPIVEDGSKYFTEH
ncbi:hypothetical protein QCD85_09945 [Paenibacillus sp. PsM32]|uniref:hypothetical protein n=1 Tax=unclassified Paenibacillus TaxID=185978 RepID=UPI002366AAEA|nr:MULTISPECIES: hypothetical protein [unclassified Paenibacillus]MDN4618419.1 hypothetical protein [Paenibacillus sp. PsM32]WDF52946.1 hypothetical protein PQ460_11180 [Paenibacillus sp. KACC 21273]